jgi:WD40 repeat protein
MRVARQSALPFLVLGICLADEPILVINNGGHTATVRSVVFTRDGRSILSAGDDKLVRIWDTQTGRVRQTVWGQVGPGLEGTIDTMALSPDNRVLAVAGQMPGKRPRDAGAIRLHAFPEGEVAAVLQGAGDVTECLAFSPDSRLLVSGSADFGVRIWDVAQRRMLREITNKARIHGITFSPNGLWVAWGTHDGNVRVWDISRNREVFGKTVAGAPIASLAFSPDSRYLAATSVDAKVMFWDASGGFASAGEIRANTIGVNPANLSFMPDGRSLLVTSHVGTDFVASMVDFPGGTTRVRFTRHNELIQAAGISPDGRTVVTAGGDDNEIYLWDTTSGSVLRKLAGTGAAVWAVAFSQDGRSVAFGTERYGSQVGPDERGPLQHVIRLSDEEDRYHVSSTQGITGFTEFPAIHQMRGLSLDTVQNGTVLQISRGGSVVSKILRDQASGYRHLSYTFTPDGRRIVTGALNGNLTVYSADNGKKLFDLVGHVGAIEAVNVSPDGRTLVTGSNDQTVRLWDLDSRKNLLSFFLGNDNEWVAWTPEGYYASSLNGDKYVGWLVDQGNSSAVRYYSVAQFQKTYYRPEVVSEHLKRRDITIALHAANVGRGRPDQPVAVAADIPRALPPEIYLAEPSNDAVITNGSFKIKGVALSTTLPITTVKILVDDLTVGEYKPNSPRQEIDLDVSLQNLPLQQGKHTVRAVANNASAVSNPELRDIVFKPATTTVQHSALPDLIFLAIGISKYREAGISLQFADEDARALQTLILKEQHTQLFNNVKTKLLTNGDATREGILNALDWLRTEGNQNDVRVLFLAGHGELSPLGDNTYFFSTYEHESGKNLDIHGIRWISLLEALRGGKGRAILMVDTCHAAAVSGERGLAPVDIEQVIKENNQELAYTGITYFTASRGSEYSLESPEWRHGAFTKALLEGIQGKAPQQGQAIQSIDLGSWISQRVLDLTGKKQHAAFFSEPRDMPPFPIFTPVK